MPGQTSLTHPGLIHYSTREARVAAKAVKIAPNRTNKVPARLTTCLTAAVRQLCLQGRMANDYSTLSDLRSAAIRALWPLGAVLDNGVANYRQCATARYYCGSGRRAPAGDLVRPANRLLWAARAALGKEVTRLDKYVLFNPIITTRSLKARPKALPKKGSTRRATKEAGQIL